MESNFKALIQLTVITLLLTAGVGVFSFSSSRADSVIVYVNTAYPYPTGDGTADRPYRTIQQGIDEANPGDSIYVFKGLYNETLTINKEITIMSDDRENTTIHWGGKSRAYLIEITADLVSLEDLNITDPSNKIRTALIHVVADYARLVGVRVTHGHKWGVYLDGSDDNTIGFSRFDNSSSDSIHAVASSNNVFTNNQFDNNDAACISFSYCDNCILFNNTIRSSNAGVSTSYSANNNYTKNIIKNCALDGISIYGEQDHLIKNNNITYCGRYGIYLDSSDSHVIGNTLYENQMGLSLSKSRCVVHNNRINNSQLTGVFLSSGTQSIVLYENTFIDNPVNAEDYGTNTWFDNTTGNYWDDYDDVDRNLDGIGDFPHSIEGGGQDPYPTGKFLKPPQQPTSPLPSDGQDNVGLSILLSVNVTDADSERLTVTFYKGTDNSIIGGPFTVDSSSRATCYLALPFQTTFTWYTTVNDSKLENQSSIWFFTTKLIPPTNKKPIAYPGGPYVGKVGQTISFDGSASIDPDPDGSIIFYRWNFGDGSSEILDDKPLHTYTDPGAYKVTLTVVDKEGRSAIENTTATITTLASNSPPVALGSVASSAEVNQLVTFDASNSYDIDGSIVGYRWDFNGDGSFDTDWLTSVVTTHTYADAGSYLCTLEVKDDADATGSFSTSITIAEEETGTPGFEVVLVLFAILLCALVYRKQRR